MTELRCAIELRADDTGMSPGRLTGTLITYGKRALDRPEIFSPGALEWPPAGVILNRQHDRRSPIMKVVPEVRGNEVVIDAALPETVAGRDAATEVRSGMFKSLSIEFRSVLQSYRNGTRVIQRAVLEGAGLVDNGSHDAPVEVRRRRRNLFL